MSIGKHSFACSKVVKCVIGDGEFKDSRKFRKFGNIPNVVGKITLYEYFRISFECFISFYYRICFSNIHGIISYIHKYNSAWP